ncbi:uncharacterized protein si:dkey-260g12.1 isoform X2 [Mugil cephalus]|uniref:uncharacterized protein si:dkey-260g12.1 isoform X2 n=1 Tax=Mugil cephalus TaxID=48193 RepID=UPI001FB7DC14|nr:uncharacterized protein si:dkey-260g12.1 isoform X2 [Mugil cephalus]
MGFVQYFVAVLMVLAQQALTYPVSERTDESEWCSAGEYRLSRSKCEPCPANQYTTKRNLETSCHRCFGDCRPEFNLIVVQNCTSTSDLKCICAPGFNCNDFVPVSMNCRECEKIQETTAPEVLTSSQTKQTPPSAPSKHSSTPKPCQSPNCDPGPFPKPFNGTNPKTDHTSSQLAAILCPVVVLGSVALVILFCGRGPGDRTCFRQTIAKICHEERQDASHKTKESTHHLPRDSFSAKQQSSSLSASNLGPVHVHNPGTVIFSLLNHFTGQVGPTIVGGKTTERINSEEEDERDCPVFHPTSPHSIHLSEEERSGEIDSIFFPSQEQGKDCHVSKEEAL